MLEPCEGKLSSTVLREERGSNPSDLLDYKSLCDWLCGDWINCGGGSVGLINPLEFRSIPLEDDDLDSDETSSMGGMALHFKSFEIFMKLYIPDLTEIQKALLKQVLEELYNNFGINWTTDPKMLTSKDYPVFKDLYMLLKKHFAESDDKTNFEHLSVIIRELAEGSDSFIWNGHTTLNPKSNFICLDTFDLQNTSDTIKKTQYYNILTWAWEQMSRDRTEKVLLVADEAYLLVDQNVPQSLIFLRNVAKRARKYESGICIITHSIVDFLDPSIKMYGQALLDIPCFKIIMGVDGQNLHEVSKLLDFTDMEQELTAAKKRGYAIVCVGNRHYYWKFDISPFRLSCMGGSGGR